MFRSGAFAVPIPAFEDRGVMLTPTTITMFANTRSMANVSDDETIFLSPNIAAQKGNPGFWTARLEPVDSWLIQM